MSYLARSTNNEFPHYNIPSYGLLSLPPCEVKTYPSSPSSQCVFSKLKDLFQYPQNRATLNRSIFLLYIYIYTHEG
jgi:hypothetical protein